MALFAVDQAFIKNFQDIAFDLVQAEAADMGDDLSNQRLADWVADHPVEKITFDRAVNASRSEGFTRQQFSGIVLGQLHHRKRNALCDNNEIGMLKPKRVIFDVATINLFEQFGP